MTALFAKEKSDLITHLATESHVGRSIDGPADFIQTNTFSSLQPDFIMLMDVLTMERIIVTGRVSEGLSQFLT